MLRYGEGRDGGQGSLGVALGYTGHPGYAGQLSVARWRRAGREGGLQVRLLVEGRVVGADGGPGLPFLGPTEKEITVR